MYIAVGAHLSIKVVLLGSISESTKVDTHKVPAWYIKRDKFTQTELGKFLELTLHLIKLVKLGI